MAKKQKVSAPPIRVNEDNEHSSGSIEKIIRGHLYLLVVLIPLVFWLDTQTIFTMPKLLVLRTVSLSAAIFILMKFFQDREVKLVFPGRSIFLGFWLISLILSTVFSINPVTSIYGQYGRYLGLITFINLLLIPIYIRSYFSTEKLKKLLAVSVITSILVAFYGLLQYANFFGLWKLPFEWTDSPQNRLFATMGHANHLAAYLSAHFLMLAYCLSIPRDKKQIWFFIAKILGMTALVWVIVLTASRGAILALIATALILILLRTWKYRVKLREKLKKITLISFVVVVLVAAGALVFYQQLQELSIVKRTEQTITSFEKGIVPERISFLHSAWSMFLDHPLLGTGLSTFRDAYSAYRRADYYIDGPGNAQYITVPESAHNEYLDILATQGLFGLICYLGLLIAVYQLMFKRYLKAQQGQENYYLAILGGLLIFSLQTLFNFGEIVNWFLFFLLVGVALADDTRCFTTRWKLPAYILYPAIIVLLMAAMLGFREGVLSESIADYYYRQAREAQATGQNQLADQYYQVVISAKPREYQLYQSYGDFSLAAAADASAASTSCKTCSEFLKKAVTNYQTAISLNPNYPSTYHNLALAYLQLHRLTTQKSYLDLSHQYFQLSVEKSPNNPRYLYEFARKLHSEWDDRRGAVKLLRQALQISPGYQEPQDYLNFLYKYHPELKQVE